MNANTIVRRCLTALANTDVPPADAELLARFTAHRDHDAFAALVHRHGPIVLAACRRVLGHSSDAEDAFQTTFVALARHASSIRGPAALPAWLHRTALRAANRAAFAPGRRRPACRPSPPIRWTPWPMWPGAICAACSIKSSTGCRRSIARRCCPVSSGRAHARRGGRTDRLLPQHTQAAAGGGPVAPARPTAPPGHCADRSGRGRTRFGWTARGSAGSADRVRSALRERRHRRASLGRAGVARAGWRWPPASRSAWERSAR